MLFFSHPMIDEQAERDLSSIELGRERFHGPLQPVG